MSPFPDHALVHGPEEGMMVDLDLCVGRVHCCLLEGNLRTGVPGMAERVRKAGSEKVEPREDFHPVFVRDEKGAQVGMVLRWAKAWP
jgi:hypothetical protein